ncbi:MAG: ATP-binding cassette domain-containing protein [Streptosporangiales bacterium]|nr:ATP-binding cassette domain-containing protein [Streptosporangiales bacterium]
MRRGLRLLATAIREEPRIFVGALVGSALYGGMTVASAEAIGWATSNAIVPAFEDGRVPAGLLWAGAAFVVAVALLKILGILGRKILAGVMQYRLMATYRRRVTRQYLRLPFEWHQRHPTGQLLSNANSDVETLWNVIAPLPMALGVVVMIVVAMVSMWLTDPVLALVGMCVFPLLAGVNYVYQRRMRPVAMESQHLRGAVSSSAHESFEGALVVKTLGREADETRRFRADSDALRDTNIRLGRLAGVFDPIMEGLPNLGILVVLLVGSVRVDAGLLTAGALVKVAYLFILLAFPIRAFGWVLGNLPRAVVGWDRVNYVLESRGELPFGEGEAGDGGPPRLRLDTVSFAYPEADGDALSDVTLNVPSGRTVALVGPTGAGKSTLVGLLSRLVDPRAGSITLDDVDLRSLRRGALSETVAVVPQQTFLFEDTVRDNVTLGDEFTDAEVWAALRLAQAERFVRSLSDGLDTLVGERGTTLSGGQRQRVALARALVRRPRLLVLDDATSSVDPQVEARILDGLRTGLRDADATVLVVAYRQSTIALADEVVFVDRGTVVDRGTHDELLERSAGYRDLVTAYERQQQEREADLSREGAA